MSRRRGWPEDEQKAWLQRRDREREEAKRKAQEQRRPIPGYRRLTIEEE